MCDVRSWILGVLIVIAKPNKNPGRSRGLVADWIQCQPILPHRAARGKRVGIGSPRLKRFRRKRFSAALFTRYSSVHALLRPTPASRQQVGFLHNLLAFSIRQPNHVFEGAFAFSKPRHDKVQLTGTIVRYRLSDFELALCHFSRRLELRCAPGSSVAASFASLAVRSLAIFNVRIGARAACCVIGNLVQNIQVRVPRRPFSWAVLAC